MVAAPFADFTWRHARKLAAQAGRDDTSETEVARVLDELLTRAQAGPPADKATARVAARTRVAAAAHRPPPRQEPAAVTSDSDDDAGGGWPRWSRSGSSTPTLRRPGGERCRARRDRRGAADH